MALIDVSDILRDPDFTNVVTLIRRAVTINEHGENVMAETACYITAVVQGDAQEILEKLPDGARLSDAIMVYFRGTLTAERPGGYADIIVWNGRRYQVKEIAEDFHNYGAGFTKALCLLEAVSV
jgi:hypothetical protein